MEKMRQQPNILLVFSDQHRWCDLGCYGNQQVISPNLDAFSQKAIRFTRCISNSPVCVPARGSLLTGLFPLKHGAVSNDLPIRGDVESLAHVLNRNGYHTGYVGKWHLGGIPRDRYIPQGPERLGFQEWKVCNCNHAYLDSYYDDEQNERVKIDGYEPIEQTSLAVDFIQRNQHSPWGLVLSWGPPHDPYRDVPEKYLDLYRDIDIQLRENVPDTVKHTLQVDYSREQIKEFHKGYYAHITALDEQFGRLIATLEETGQLDNTLVIYTSDHGDMLGSQGVTNKQWPYEESIRVPLMAYWKGRTLTGTTDEMMGLVDLPVSLLGLAGVGFGGKVDGKDLNRLFTDRGAQGLEAAYIFDHIPCHQAFDRGSSEWRGIRTRQYTYVRSASDQGFMLYDNQKDPYQMENLVNRPECRETAEVLRKQLDEYITAHDTLLPWEEFIRACRLTEGWNRSQAYFNRPLLEEQV